MRDVHIDIQTKGNSAYMYDSDIIVDRKKTPGNHSENPCNHIATH